MFPWAHNKIPEAKIRDVYFNSHFFGNNNPIVSNPTNSVIEGKRKLPSTSKRLTSNSEELPLNIVTGPNRKIFATITRDADIRGKNLRFNVLVIAFNFSNAFNLLSKV